jgi:hypothetical protein
MKTIVDTPEFTAWLLGELPEADAATMARAVAVDPALELAAREQQQFLQQVTGLLGGSQESLDARQREKIMRAARSQAADHIVALPQKQSGRGWGWISLATAAVAVVGVWIGFQNPLKTGKGHLTVKDVTREIALLPSDAPGFPEANSTEQGNAATAVGGTSAATQRDALLTRQPDEYMQVIAKRIAIEPLPSATELPAIRERGFVDAAQHPLAPLPLHVGMASWNWIKRSITEEQKLPHPSMVRAEEIINAFPFEAGQQLAQNNCILRTESFAQGRDRARVVVSLRNAGNTAQQVTWGFVPMAGSRYRLIGFGSSVPGSKMSGLLPAGGSVTLMLEIESALLTDRSGELLFTVAGQENRLPLTLSNQPSTQAAYFSLLSDFASWLRSPKSSTSELQQMVESLETLNPSVEQMTALSLMKKAFILNE